MSTKLMANITEELTRLERIESAEDRAYAAIQMIDVLQRAVGLTAAVRGAAMRELRSRGWTMARIGSVFGISRARVAQIISNGGTDRVHPDGAEPGSDGRPPSPDGQD